jgi:peptide/nickel transport system substrate-binding protein
MGMLARMWVLVVVLAVVLAACAPAGAVRPTEGSASAGGDPESQAPKRVTAAIRSIPGSLSQMKTNRSVGSVPGLDALEELVHGGLVHFDQNNQVQPQLAQAAPTIENGNWRLFPDGRMETVWTLKPDLRWHDGAPLTTADLLFGTMIEQDAELGVPRYPAYDLIERIEALDARSIVVRWRQPYIEADAMFSYQVGLPHPRHLLERAYEEDKATFLSHPYWTSDFVGAGPFLMREWVVDSHVVLRAFDDYALGRPKIDEIEVKFIPDPTTLLANMLAGVEVAIGRTVSFEQAMEVRDQWRDGQVASRMGGWVPINAQFINANPPIVTDVRFRRALLEAIDRQQLVASLMLGHGGIAHAFVSSDTREYRDIERAIVKYEFNPRRSAQALEELGYRRGSDGILLDAANQRLAVSIYSTVQNAIHPKATPAVADSWQQVGVAVEQVMVPIQRARDREYRATFPAFELVATGNGLDVARVMRFHSSAIALPENRFQNTGNNSRYRDPMLDAHLERYVTTIPWSERMEALAGVVRHQTENLAILGLIYNVNPSMVANRVQNVVPRGERFTEAWNAHEWELRSP